MQATNTASKFEVRYNWNEGTQLGFIEEYALPDGKVVKFENDKINFEPMREFIGEEFRYYKNGEALGPHKLKDIKPTKSGVMAMHYEPVKESTGDEEESRI